MAMETLPTKKNELSEAEKEQIREKAKEALKRAKSISIVNADHLAEMEARDAADAYMTESKKSTGFFKRLWKHTFLEEYYRQRELSRVRNEIVSSGNIYTRVDQDKNAHDGAMSAIAERFALEHDEGISKNGGEERKILNENDRDAVQTKTAIKELVSQYAQGSITDEVFNSEKNRIIGALNDELIKGASTYADNLFEIAKNAKLAIEHGAKLEELDLDFDIILGKAKSSIKTEAKHNTIDKGVDWVKKSRVGRFVSPTVIAASLGVAYSAGAFFAKKALRSKASHLATFGGTALVAGALAAANESQRLAEERRQHAREMAKGGQIDGESPRRESMEKYTYATENAGALIAGLRDSLFVTDKNGKETPKQITEMEYETVMAKITDIEARNALADRKNIDLVSYSSPSNVEKERTELTILLARSKVELRKQVEERLTSVLPVDPKTGKSVALSDVIRQQVETACGAFLEGEKGIDAKDKAFSNLKLRRAALKAGEAVLIGLTVGAATQEILAGADGLWGGTKEGIIEGMMHNGGETHNTVQTPLEHIRGWMTGNPSHLAGQLQDYVIDGNHIKLPGGVDIIKNTDGTFNIIHGDQTVSEHIKLIFDESGHLDQDSIERLGEDGMIANSETVNIGGKEEVVTDPKDYISKHPEATTHIKRELWYGNDTPMYRDLETGKLLGADQNELKTHWGGVNGTGVDTNGDYVFNVAKMTPDGSYQTIDGHKMSVDAQEKIKNQGLKMLLSFSKDTQNQVVEVTIDQHGNAIFDHNDPAIKQLFSVDDKGRAVFNGKFAEVAQTVGVKDGIEHVKVIATHVGQGIESVTHIVDSTKEIGMNTISVPLDDEHPYFIPIVSRTPLEPIKYGKTPKSSPEFKKKKPPIPMNPYYYPYGMNPENFDPSGNRETWSTDMSPRLIADPEAKLNPTEEINWYFKDQRRRYPGYVEKELTPLLAQEPAPMGKNIESVVCLAVAGHQEHANIFRTLDTYRVQQGRDGKSVWDGDNSKTEIFVYVNWPKGKDPSETFKEIERFKTEHPEVLLRIYSEEISTGMVEVGWYKKKVFDLALSKHAERNNGKDILLIANDADMTFSSPYYLEDTRNKMNDPENAQYDAILGRFDLDASVYEQYPTFHASMRFWQFMEAAMRSKHNFVGTQGRNTIMRGASYAAVGGNRTRDFWADIEFGQLFDHARKGSSVAYENSTWVTVDPRREIDKFKSGELLAHTWFDFNTREVRGVKSEHTIPENMDVEQLATLPEDDPIVVQFRSRIQNEIQEIVNIFGNINPTYSSSESQMRGIDLEVVKKAVGFLGMEATYEERAGGVNITITNTSKLRRGLLAYKQENRKEAKTKRNPLTTGQSIPARSMKSQEPVEPAEPELPTNPKELRQLAREFVEMLRTDPKLMKTFKNAYNKYFDLIGYKRLKPNNPRRIKIDKEFEQFKARSVNNSGVTMDVFLARSLTVMNREFAKQLLSIKKAKEGATVVEENEPTVVGFEVKEDELESPKLRTEMRAALNTILKEKGGAKIKSFKMDIVDDKIKADVVLDAGLVGGQPSISITLGVENDNFVFAEKPKISARGVAQEPVISAIAEIPAKIKEVLGTKRKGKVSGLSLGDNKLKLKLE